MWMVLGTVKFNFGGSCVFTGKWSRRRFVLSGRYG